ncbi:DDE-type integrase/transposase/recombinase [Undibacterium sp. GrIS 1.8]|uniref:DDE-type integrase/transposase/recombinase n=1 Tax=Undibacterium sp. GrIS 1.8 TaxID=3143934 RepID=UPI003395C512
MRASKYLNRSAEQDNRAIKLRTRPMLGFEQFHFAAKIIAGIETMHMVKNGRFNFPENQDASATD